MLGLSHLISHRFRGFSQHENTLDGLTAALDFGVANLEFDVRVTRCGTPIIYHDEYARDTGQRKRYISGVMAAEFHALGGTFAHIPTAEAMLAAAARHQHKTTKLLIDIKDGGFEDMIHALVCAHGLQRRVVYVSWVPNVLYRMHDIAPSIPLCLSHWCQSPSPAVRLLHHVYEAQNGHIPRLQRDYIHGERSGWYVNGSLRGALRDIIMQSGGSVCVPKNMVTRDIVDAYHADNITVSTFSYTKWSAIHAHNRAYNIDQYFIDNKDVFDKL